MNHVKNSLSGKIKATLKESLEYKGIHIEANTDLVFVFQKLLFALSVLHFGSTGSITLNYDNPATV
ncbi:hypothetical protein [Acinetobacter towneri]|uniref:hypothetical protein n=1 Tax=Acinetobacter towneri TaxID=202956 RepID=UPI00209BB371|nr:hypothetical protein [Acinetobacter towneri]MCO8055338.1 hypothetical protein [Acinetobacter towneri]